MLSLKRFLLLAGVISLGVAIARVDAIISRKDSVNLENKIGGGLSEDNQISESIHKDYYSGYEVNYGHDSSGLSAYSSVDFSENHDGYEGFDGYHYDDPHFHHHYLHHHHKHYDHDSSAYHKALAIKGLLVPLAGVALLGAAAAFVSNPILLQLGVISGAYLGRRKRDTRWKLNTFETTTSVHPENEIRLKEIKLLERFMAQIPKKEIEEQEKKILANYLSCSGIETDNFCLERLACELQSEEGISMPIEANVFSIVINEILNNEFVPDNLKKRVSMAVDRGKKNLKCDAYSCVAFGK